MIQAGDLNITRNVTNGRILRTQLNRIFENKNYSAFGELTVHRNRYQNSRIYQDFRFTRDRLGRISQKLETLEGSPQATFNYVYDTSGRLTSVQKNGAAVLSQVFDSNSNRTQVTENGSTINATYDSKDQILTWGTLQFTHNLNGELITITDSSYLPAGSTSFTYNVFGHLKSVTLPNGSQITYALDAFNRRVGKRLNGTLQKQFLWQDELRIAAEYDGSGNLVSEFIYAQSVNVPDYMIRGGIKYKLVKDNLGSILAVVNSANGVVAQQLSYSTYGQVLTDSNPGFQPFGFAGGLYDSDTKLVRFGAREYNGTIGRWMTKDPILFNGGDTNLYGYVLQDLVNYFDPSGFIFENAIANRTTPNQQGVLGLGLISAGTLAIRAGVLSLNPLLAITGGLTAYEGVRNFQKALERKAQIPGLEMLDEVNNKNSSGEQLCKN